MNATLTDNNISALLDTNDGNNYLKNFRKYLGDVQTRVINDYTSSIARGSEINETPTRLPTAQFLEEAFMIVASFAEIGRASDIAVGNVEVLSEERSRINAMLIAILTFSFGYNMRIAKESFMDVLEQVKGEQDLSQDTIMTGLILYLTENKSKITEEAYIVRDMMNLMAKRVYDECVNGLVHNVI